MNVGALQLSGFAGDVSKNLELIRVHARRGAEAGCQLLLFPEISDLAYDLAAVRRHTASSWRLVRDELGRIAHDCGLCLVCGVCAVEDRVRYNSLAAWGPDGRLLTRYDKTHLLQAADADETLVFSPGSLIRTFTLDGFRVGLALCYDLRFPELFRTMALQGCDVLLLASAWPQSRINVFETLCQARAMENQFFLIGANRVGAHAVFFCGGRSVIAAPWGLLAQAADPQDSLITAELDQQALLAARKALPSLDHRRPDIYTMSPADRRALTQD